MARDSKRGLVSAAHKLRKTADWVVFLFPISIIVVTILIVLIVHFRHYLIEHSAETSTRQKR
jgi:hypothetical protein